MSPYALQKMQFPPQLLRSAPTKAVCQKQQGNFIVDRTALLLRKAFIFPLAPTAGSLSFPVSQIFTQCVWVF